LRESSELVQARQGIAGLDRFTGETDSISQTADFSPDYEARCGVQKNDVLPGTSAIGEDFSDDPGILSRAAPLNSAYGSPFYSEIFGRDIIGANFSISDLGYFAFAADCDFIESIGSMDYESTLGSELAENLGHDLREIFVIDPEHLGCRLSRIADWTQEVENRADFHLSPGKHNVSHGFMQQRSVEEPDAHFVNASGNGAGIQVDPYAHGFNDVSAPAQARDTPVAMLSHLYAGSGQHERSCSRNIESPGRIPSGATRVDEHLPVGAR
jgi:hypothetical protein